MKVVSILILLLVFVGDSPAKKSFKIYIEKDGAFRAFPFGPDPSIDQLSEAIGETLPEGVVIYANEEMTLSDVLKVIYSIESESPKTKIRVVTSTSYSSQPILREFVVTPLKKSQQGYACKN